MMGWYTRSSRFIVTFGSNQSKTSAFRYNSRISHNLVYQNVLNMNKQRNSPFVDGPKRFYLGDRRRIKHPIISALTMAGCVVVGGIEILRYLEKSRFSLETVPYTNRKHFLLFSVSQKKAVAWKTMELIKLVFKDEIMAPDHPLSIRAQKIGDEDDIVEIVKSQNPHLNELEWEFFVLVHPTSVSAANFPVGKIVVPSILLNRFRGDDEVAAFIAREVGHVVARHYIEGVSNRVRKRHSQAIFKLILSPFYDSYEAARVLSLPDLRRMELEADYIGLILMAYAGYDPRVAPRLCQKFGSKIPVAGFLTFRPCGETRAQLLLQPQVMGEALSVYREVLTRRGIKAESAWPTSTCGWAGLGWPRLGCMN